MSGEIKKVEVLDSNGNEFKAEFNIYEESPDNEEQVLLELEFNNKKYTATDDNFFNAMVTIRKELEKQNFLLNCYGASKQVYPSGMALNMGYGRKAYKLQSGQQAKIEDLVDIFEMGEDIKPSTIEVQQAFYENWLTSILNKS